MKESTQHTTRGFTLVELMAVVSIIGVLASVALPQYQRAVLRARAAESATIMDAVARAVNDAVTQQQSIPGGTWVGVANPPGVPGASKRAFDWTLAGWTQFPTIVAGNAYYTYSFVALDPTGDGKNISLSVTSVGDLDADGVLVTRTNTFGGVGYSFTATGSTVTNPDMF